MIPTQVVRAPTQNNYISGLTTEQFNRLFDEEINPETLDVLGKQAGNGDLNSIELLHNIALRQGSSGKKPKISYSIYSVVNSQQRKELIRKYRKPVKRYTNYIPTKNSQTTLTIQS
nr:hypothetical protein [Providencia sp. PROV212]